MLWYTGTYTSYYGGALSALCQTTLCHPSFENYSSFIVLWQGQMDKGVLILFINVQLVDLKGVKERDKASKAWLVGGI